MEIGLMIRFYMRQNLCIFQNYIPKGDTISCATFMQWDGEAMLPLYGRFRVRFSEQFCFTHLNFEIVFRIEFDFNLMFFYATCSNVSPLLQMVSGTKEHFHVQEV
jgi:hypothetical protein